MSRLPVVLLVVTAAATAAPVRAAHAQACIGLPAHAPTTLTLGIEASDGVGARTASIAHRHGDWGIQVRGLLHDGSAVTDPWYGGQASISAPLPARWVGTASGAGLSRCVVASLGYWDDRQRESRYERVRVPVGLSVGREFILGADDAGATSSSVTLFGQALVALQHERWRESRDADVALRLRHSTGAAVGVGGMYRFLVARTSLQYMTYPEYALKSQVHNWLELRLDAGVAF